MSASPLAAHLDHVLAAVRDVLGRLAPGEGGAPTGMLAARAVLVAAAEGPVADADVWLPDFALARRFGLGPLERALIWFVTAPHLDPTLADVIARANDDVREQRVDLALVLRAFARTRDEQLELARLLATDAPLVQTGLVAVSPRPATPNRMRAWLDPGEHVVPLFLGSRALSPSAAPYARWVAPWHAGAGAGAHDERVVTAVAAVLRGMARAATARTGPLGPGGLDLPAGVAVVVEGDAGTGRAVTVREAARRAERHVIEVDGRLLAAAPADARRRALHAVFREAELFGDVVLLRDPRELVAPGKDAAAEIAHALRRRAATLVLASLPQQALDPALEGVVVARHHLPGTERATQATLWRAHLPDAVPEAAIAAVAEALHLQPLQIRRAATLAQMSGADGVEAAGLIAAARAQLTKTIGDLALVSEPRATFADLVLDGAMEGQLREIVTAARSRREVLEGWGIGRRIHRGTGIVALFDGAPGTGKTQAAEAIAGELGLSLVRVNIASVVDKYIGETEKNLTRIFESARPETNLLLFDEADSLFSKRTTEVERASDRYSNMDINVLLQLIERYAGVTVLTTNLKKAIDKAFERRFTFKLSFGLPEWEERHRLWCYLLPEDVVTAEPIDYELLADIELAGGEIKNAILLGAYAAACAGERLTTARLLTAAEREAAATGRLVRHRAAL
ncbi:MAG: ATP-binding protein [Deltaproteobacteria bacterium]|nr:ATP-binding protein [Deltaproteobacteria bacterium]